MIKPKQDPVPSGSDEDFPTSPRPVSQELLEAVLLLLLKPGDRPPTKKDLAKKIGKSQRAVADAISRLKRDGAEIKEGHDQRNSRYLTYRVTTPPAWYTPVSPEASMALRVVFEALGNGMAGAWRKHLEALSTLVEGKLSESDKTRIDQIKSRIGVSGGRSSRIPDGQVLQDILSCLGDPYPKKVELRYASANQGEDVDLSITPWCLLHDLFSSTAFLLCWDWTRDAPSLLRKYRILSFKIGTYAALVPDQKTALERCATYQIGGFASPEEPEQLQVRVSGRLWAKAFLDQPPGLPNVLVEPEGADAVRVSFMACEYRAPARWVLQMGPDAEVLSPPSFVAYVATRARDTANVYPT